MNPTVCFACEFLLQSITKHMHEALQMHSPAVPQLQARAQAQHHIIYTASDHVIRPDGRAPR